MLATWRRCEEELLAANAADAEADKVHNDAAHSGGGANGERKHKSAAPGAFDEGSIQDTQIPRVEMGRGTLNARDEAPMGLFDVARGAAAALGRSSGGIPNLSNMPNIPNLGGLPTLGGLRAALPHTLEDGGAGGHDNIVDGGRVRRRDMVASAVTGGLASGLGWMLGATPVGVAGADGAEDGDDE